MDGTAITAIVAPIAGVFGKLIGRGPRLRRSVDDYLTLYERLPESSEARSKILKHIDSLVDRLIEDETTKGRDPMGIGIALFFLIGAVAMFGVARHAESWAWAWWIGLVLVALIGVGGMSSSLPLAERDEKGNTISKER